MTAPETRRRDGFDADEFDLAVEQYLLELVDVGALTMGAAADHDDSVVTFARVDSERAARAITGFLGWTPAPTHEWVGPFRVPADAARNLRSCAGVAVSLVMAAGALLGQGRGLRWVASHPTLRTLVALTPAVATVVREVRIRQAS